MSYPRQGQDHQDTRGSQIKRFQDQELYRERISYMRKDSGQVSAEDRDIEASNHDGGDKRFTS